MKEDDQMPAPLVHIVLWALVGTVLWSGILYVLFVWGGL
jgi:hypothetical protein